ncbi:hypothetical protein D3C78_1663030 [compost metagenome]
MLRSGVMSIPEITASYFLNLSAAIRLSNAWLVKVHSAFICLHSALARSISKPTILLLASNDSNGG